MPEHMKALAYVLAISIPVLFVAGRIAIPLIGRREFALWKYSWLVTTIAVFLSRDFMLFAAFTGLLSFVIHRHAQRPAMLYIVLLFAAPCVSIGFGIPGLFNRITDLNLPRLLGLFLLLPIALKQLQEPSSRVLRGSDLPVLCMWLLWNILAIRQDDINATLRLLPGYTLDIFLPYFAISRSIRTSDHVNQTLLAFAVAVMPLAAIGIFEILRSWRIYYSVVLDWDVVLITPYLFRDGLLRAAATAIEAIAFGFICMVGAGALLSIRSSRMRVWWRGFALCFLLGGLAASISRGPWLGFVIFIVTIAAADRHVRWSFASKLMPLMVIGIFLVPNSLLDRVIGLLPFVGSVGDGTETYRELLFQQSLLVIQQNLLFGTKDFLSAPEMQILIQGQGIIDVVNSYLQVALEFGLVGFTFFVSAFLTIGCQLMYRIVKGGQDDVYYQGLLGVLIAICFTIITTSSVTFITYICWSFAGLLAGALRIPSTRLNPDASRSASVTPQALRIIGRGI